jgi:hypothetical protein
MTPQVSPSWMKILHSDSLPFFYPYRQWRFKLPEYVAENKPKKAFKQRIFKNIKTLST